MLNLLSDHCAPSYRAGQAQSGLSLLATLLVFGSLALSPVRALAQSPDAFAVNDHHIVYHDVRVDASGNIIPWNADDPAQAYDQNIRRLWKFWIEMRNCPNGVPYYLQHQVWKPDQDDSRGLGGDQIDMTLDAWSLLYGYLGDPAILQNMTMIADYWLDHGMSASSSLWPNLPYPYNTDLHSGQYDGDMRAGKGYLQPDKAGSFGAELVMLYKLTGNPRYLKAAIGIADTLAAHAVPGDQDHSPWPFRVNASTGKTAEQQRNGTLYTAGYTSNWTPTLRLFNDLEQMHKGDGQKYHQVSTLVTAWLKKYPMQTNKWGPFFEDIETADYSDTEINADTMAAYILQHPEWDTQWREHARSILQWSETHLGNHNFEKLHVVPMNEQTAYLVPGNSHTARHASVELIYCQKTGDCERKEPAIRRLNWATYSVDTDGKNRYPSDDVWLTDGYGDYIRHYLRAMAALPRLAPGDQDHLLSTTSLVQHIEYQPAAIAYRKFDARSVETIKLGKGKPKAVTGGKMSWNPETHMLTVNSTAREVVISIVLP